MEFLIVWQANELIHTNLHAHTHTHTHIGKHTDSPHKRDQARRHIYNFFNVLLSSQPQLDPFRTVTTRYKSFHCLAHLSYFIM